MKTELVNNIAKEATCQLQYYINLNIEHEKVIKYCLYFFQQQLFI